MIFINRVTRIDTSAHQSGRSLLMNTAEWYNLKHFIDSVEVTVTAQGMDIDPTTKECQKITRSKNIVCSSHFI